MLPRSSLLWLTLLTASVLPEDEDKPRVKTEFGIVEGIFKLSEPSSRRFSSFEGIPYASPPIDTLRFKPPVKLPKDVFYKPHEPLVADKFAGACAQMDRMSGEYLGSEDCLHLNVFSPETSFTSGVRHPVMVWLHGGGFQFGSSSPEMFGPERLLEEDVVLVSLNYRLGPLGFLTTEDEAAPGNVGLLDQRLALEWVRDNIASFSGDPDKVTLVGESSGGISVMAHLASPASRGLFHKAIAMSGVLGEAPFLHSSKPPASYAKLLASELGCDASGTSEEIVNCLVSKPPRDITETGAKFSEFDFIPEPFKPVVDSWNPNPVQPFPLHEVWTKAEIPDIPLMIGGNKDEGILFILEFLKTESLYARVNEKFSTLLPALLLGVDPEDAKRDEGETATAEVLRNSYLPGDGSLSPDAITQMIKLFTDVHFLSPIDQTVRKLSNRLSSLYYYNYQHKGSFSLPTAFGIWENYGVSHADELFLLFRCAQVSSSWLGDLALQTEEDFAAQRRLVSTWTGFARTGAPTQDGSWKSVQESGEVQYAVLDGEELRMEYPEEFGRRMELVQSMMKLARVHRVSDASEHPALAKMREDLIRLEDQEWEDKRENVLRQTREKQQSWGQNKDVDLFDEQDDADEDWPEDWKDELSNSEHDEL